MYIARGNQAQIHRQIGTVRVPYNEALWPFTGLGEAQLTCVPCLRAPFNLFGSAGICANPV